MTLTLPFAAAAHLPAAVAAVREAMSRSQVIALPTETFYGLAADPSDRVAVDRIYAVKGRESGKALPMVAADMAQVEELAELTAEQRGALATVWPAAVTVVLPSRVGPVPDTGTVAVRVPDHTLLRSLLARVGALTATSANRSGAPPCSTPQEVLEAVGAGVALLLDGGATAGGSPSTLLDWTGERPRIVRAGVWSMPPSWP